MLDQSLRTTLNKSYNVKTVAKGKSLDRVLTLSILPHVCISHAANDRFAAVLKRRYRTRMKISRLLLAMLLSAATWLLANDELKERLQPAIEAITPDGL